MRVAVDAAAYDGPKTLAETGLYSDFVTKTLSASVIAYDVRYPLWSDSLEKSRFISLPTGTTIDTTDPVCACRQEYRPSRAPSAGSPAGRQPAAEPSPAGTEARTCATVVPGGKPRNT